ncbi:CD2 antigen cytoplasmic tail-binding protein 2 [Pelomyxa schiedti]|nr:CD2 antigen cytoplasmic tail-binding protein 2 [Pelomyxa schiedti]
MGDKRGDSENQEREAASSRKRTPGKFPRELQYLVDDDSLLEDPPSVDWKRRGDGGAAATATGATTPDAAAEKVDGAESRQGATTTASGEAKRRRVGREGNEGEERAVAGAGRGDRGRERGSRGAGRGGRGGAGGAGRAQNSGQQKRVTFAAREREEFLAEQKKRVVDGEAENDFDEEKKSTEPLTHVKGEEASTISYDGDIKIEPFNLRQEMQEGSFDGQGNYTEFRQPRALSDAWLEECDSKYAEDMEREAEELERKWRAKAKADRMAKAEKREAIDTYACRASMLQLLLPGEDTWGALKRLGKKDGGDKAKFLKLTEAADALLASGDINIYTMNRDQIRAAAAAELLHETQDVAKVVDDSSEDPITEADLVPRTTSSTATSTSTSTSTSAPSTKPKGSSTWSNVAKNSKGSSKSTSSSNAREEESEGSVVKAKKPEVMWEYQISGNDQVQGPFTTAQMMEWVQAGCFSYADSPAVKARIVGETLYESHHAYQPILEIKFSEYL